MAGALDTAFVEIIPDFKKFAQQVKQGIDQASNDMKRGLGEAITEMGTEMQRFGDRIGKHAQEGFNDVGDAADDAASDVSSSMKDAGRKSEDALDDIGDTADSEFGTVGDAADDAGSDITSSMKKGAQGAENALDGISSTADSEFDAVGSAADSAASEAAGVFDSGAAAIEDALSGVDDAASTAFDAAADAASDAGDDVSSAFDDAADDVTDAFDDIADDAEDAADTTGDAFEDAADDTEDAWRKDGKKTREHIEDIEGEAERASDGISGTFKKAAVAVAAAFAAIQIGDWAKDAVGASFEVEQGLTEIVNVATAGAGDPALFTELNDLSGRLATELGVLSDDAIPSMYNAISAGIPVFDEFEDGAVSIEKLEDITRIAAQGAKVNLTDIGTALDATTTAMNIYASENLDAADVMDVFTATVNSGKTTLDELGPALADPAASAVQFGVSLDQVGGAMAAMTAQGVGTSESATKLRSLIDELGKSTSNAGKMFEEVAGQSFVDFVEGGGTVQEAAALMADAADEMGIGLGEVFSSVEASGAAFFLSSEAGAEAFAGVMDAVREEGSVTEGAWDNLAETGAVKMQQLQGAFEQLQLGVGQALAPIIVEIVQGLIPVIEQLTPIFATAASAVGDSLGSVADAIVPILPQVAELAGQLLPMLAELFSEVMTAAGPLIGVLITFVSDALQPIIPVISTVLTQFGRLVSGIVSAVTPIIQQLAAKLIPVIEQIAPIVANVVTMAVDFFGMLLDAIMPILPPLIEMATAILPVIADLIGAVLPLVAEAFGAILEAAMPLIEALLELLIGVLEPLMPAFIELITLNAELAALFAEILIPVIQFLAEVLLWLVDNVIMTVVTPIIVFLAELFSKLLTGVIRTFGGFFKGIVEGIVAVFKWLKERWDFFSALISAAWMIVRDKFQSGWNTIRDKVFQPIMDRAATVRDKLAGIWEKIKSAFQKVVDRFKTGADKVKGYFNGIWDAIKNAYNALARGWNKIKVEIGPYNIPDWVPVVGGKKFHIPDLIPSIPLLQESGFSFGTGAVVLHPNEAIVNARDSRGIGMLADAMRKAAGMVGGNGSSAGTVVNVESGAVVMKFMGNPTEAEATRAGEAAGMGLMRTLAARNVRLDVRRI